MKQQKTYCFDLDDTLCTTKGMDYLKSQPIIKRIKEVNNLYKNGHTILIDSARGSKTGVCWNNQTKEQLKKWGVKYHQLRCGKKFAADIYIDDKGQNADSWFN
jgi:hypothetical protein